MSSAPPPPGADRPLGFCFGCVTGTCVHGSEGRPVACQEQAGGYVPAVTALEGTPLCQDCAIAAARNIRRWHHD